MARLTRKQQKVFAESATNNGVFGSLQANDPTISSDTDVIQSRTAYTNGWNDATYSANLLPPLEEFQALQYLFSRQLAYLFQDGIPEWDSSTTYYKGALVKKIQTDGSFILYASLADNNTNNVVTDTTKWQITNTSTNFHQGIPNWRADVVYSQGDWVKSYNSSTGWTIYESIANSNLNNAVTNTSYWSIKPFTSELPLLMPQWFDYEVSDTSWLNADTFSWQPGTTYTNVYNHLVADITGKTAQTETVGSYTITYYEADDGHKIVLPVMETTVSNIYTESGAAWYYILDQTNQRFKLPRINPDREELLQTIGVRGNGMTLGITDGTTNSGMQSGSSNSIYLSCRTDSYGKAVGNTYGSAYAYNKSVGITTDVDNSGIIADLGSIESVFSGKKHLYFYVGNFSQSATEQTAGLNSSLFNNKLDLDLGNITNLSKQTIVGWGMPDYESAVTGLTASYTPAKNGYLVVTKTSTYATVVIVNTTRSIEIARISCTDSDSNRQTVMVVVNAGDTYTFNGTGTFLPAKGA